MPHTIAVPETDIDIFSEEYLRDPLPAQEELREIGPIVRLTRYDVYACARYEEVHRGLTDWQSLQSGAGVGLSDFLKERPWRPPSLLLEADPPRHDAPRHVGERLLSPRRLRGMQDEWARVAGELADEILGAGDAFDAVLDIAQRFPLRVFPDAIGLGPHGREHLLPYGDFAFNAFGPREGIVERLAPTMGPTVAWIDEQCARENLAPGSLGAEIWESADRGEIPPEQAPLIVRSLLTAGVDTTVTGIAAVLHALAGDRVQWRMLQEDRSLLPRAFEEAVRLESPVQAFFRTTTAPTTIAGVEIPAREKVVLILGAANRDPRRWDAPERFDLARDPSGHVGFGMGLHQCVGQHVARLEATVMLGALLDRVDGVDLAARPVRHLNNTLRGWDSMPMRAEPRRA
ncbi:cytochrome P450 [Microbacterium karelineae]|uniref:cytochrome P450 n=1 Tax=Microbacterium karelineae TaxID=2654283 RepID=UPI0012EA5F36|nr:cytochrome P450 [Microbacterium karelineae]